MEPENKAMQDVPVMEPAEIGEKHSFPENRCKNCQALLEEGQTFCHECGAPQKKTCLNCGAELQEEQAFCPSCGQKNTRETSQATSSIEEFNQNITNNEKKSGIKKKILSVIGIVALAAVVISYFAFQYMKVSEYKENAKLFCTTVLNAAANLEDIGNEVQSEWHSYIYNRWSIYDSIDEAVAGALSNMSDEVDSAERDKNYIDSLYSKLKRPANNSEELEELCEAVKVLYDEYEDIYDCVTSPSGNYNTFKSNFSTCDSETVEAYEDLKDLCDELN